MSLQIDTFAYTNRLRHLPPEHKLGFAIALLLITCSAPILVQILILIWISIWIVVYAGIPVAVYLRLLLITVTFWLTSLPALLFNSVLRSHLFTVQADVWQGWIWGNYYFYLSHHGVQQASELGGRAIATTACIFFVMLTVPFTEILNILRRLRCPVLLLDLMLLMYRFIFVLLRLAEEIWTAQQARSGYRTRRLWFRSSGLLIGQLLRRTLEHYRQVSRTLESRGFTGEFRVCHARHYRASQRYRFEALLGCALLIMLTGWLYVAGI